MALPGVGTNPLADTVNGPINLVKPGGWIQLVEMEWDVTDIGPWGKIFFRAVKDLFSTVSAGQGVDMREKLVSMFEDAGLEHIEHRIIVTPFGKRASERIRETSLASLFATAMGVSMTTKMLPPISVSREELDDMPAKVVEEAKEMGWEFHTFALWAQKPAK